jgi:hypothetical protein
MTSAVRIAAAAGEPARTASSTGGMFRKLRLIINSVKY